MNYRTPSLALDCVNSLVGDRADLRGGRVLIVDNQSGDNSLSVIGSEIASRGWSGWVELLPMPRNGGFAYGNNAGLQRALKVDPQLSYVVLLNPDTVVRPKAIGALLAYLDVHPSTGVAGARMENAVGEPECSAHRWPSPLGELESAQLRPLSRLLSAYTVCPPIQNVAHSCHWVSGACMAIRRETLDSVGFLDESYFLYFEEVDFCLRAKQLGWDCAFVPQARVKHFEGASTGIRKGRVRRPAYWYASRRRFFVKAYGISGLLSADLLWALGRLTLVMRRWLRLGGLSSAEEEPAWFAFDLLWGDLKAACGGYLRSIERLPRTLDAGMT